jgi:hypothetical protein
VSCPAILTLESEHNGILSEPPGDRRNPDRVLTTTERAPSLCFDADEAYFDSLLPTRLEHLHQPVIFKSTT